MSAKIIRLPDPPLTPAERRFIEFFRRLDPPYKLPKRYRRRAPRIGTLAAADPDGKVVPLRPREQ